MPEISRFLGIIIKMFFTDNYFATAPARFCLDKRNNGQL